MIRYICDICGKESETILNMSFHPTGSDLRSIFHAQSWSGDLCEKCRNNLLKLIKAEANKV